MALVTLDEVKRELRVETASKDVLITGIMEQASDVVVDYLKEARRVSDGINAAAWTEATVPGHVRRAVLRVCVRLYDDPEGLWDGGILDQGVRDILHRERDPALA